MKTEIQNQIEFGNVKVTKTKKVSGITWHADEMFEGWWSPCMTRCITKKHSRRWFVCDANLNRLSECESFKEASEEASLDLLEVA